MPNQYQMPNQVSKSHDLWGVILLEKKKESLICYCRGLAQATYDKKETIWQASNSNI